MSCRTTTLWTCSVSFRRKCRDRLLAELPTEEAGDIRDLLQYDEETAGGIMTTALVSVLGHVTAGEAIESVRVQGREVEDFYTVFVVDDDTKLLGTVPLDDLILSDTGHRIRDLVEPTVASVVPEADQEQVGHMIARYNLASIPVVSDEGVLLGRITFDDVIDVIEAESTEDLLLFSGVSEAEELRGSSFEAVRARLPWLLLNTLTASLAASVVWWFRSEIAAATLLAVVMPVVAGLGGNAGQQALAVTVRRLATSAGPLEARGHVVRKEILVGVLNGGAIGALVAGGGGHARPGHGSGRTARRGRPVGHVGEYRDGRVRRLLHPHAPRSNGAGSGRRLHCVPDGPHRPDGFSPAPWAGHGHSVRGDP